MVIELSSLLLLRHENRKARTKLRDMIRTMAVTLENGLFYERPIFEESYSHSPECSMCAFVFPSVKGRRETQA